MMDRWYGTAVVAGGGLVVDKALNGLKIKEPDVLLEGGEGVLGSDAQLER